MGSVIRTGRVAKSCTGRPLTSPRRCSVYTPVNWFVVLARHLWPRSHQSTTSSIAEAPHRALHARSRLITASSASVSPVCCVMSPPSSSTSAAEWRRKIYQLSLASSHIDNANVLPSSCCFVSLPLCPVFYLTKPRS